MKKLFANIVFRVILYTLSVMILFIVVVYLSSLFFTPSDVFSTVSKFCMQLSFLIVVIIGYNIEKIKSFDLRSISAVTFLLIVFTAGLLNVLYPVFQNYFYDQLLENVLVITSFQWRSIGIVTFLHTIIIMPILEEFLYRGIFIRILSVKNNAFVSIILSSALFSIGHLKVEQLFVAFIFGLLVGIIYFKTKNLTICIVFHSLSNLMLHFSSDIQIAFKQEYLLLLFILCVALYASFRFLIILNLSESK